LLNNVHINSQMLDFNDISEKSSDYRPRVIMTRTRYAVTLAPRLAKKPAVLRLWLLNARWAQVALLLLILFMPNFIPSAVDAQLEKLYPPITTKKWYGLVRSTATNPRLESRQKLARVVLWAGSGFIVLYLLLLHIPRAIDHATALARERESKADSLAESRLSESILLYHSALSLTTDSTYEDALGSKLKILDKQLYETNLGRDGETPMPTTVEGQGKPTMLQAEPSQKGSRPPGSTRSTDALSGGVSPERRYVIRDELGRGAMGIVYRGYDRVLERDVALKQLSGYFSGDPQLVVRFKQEAKVLARLSHPHIVQVYDYVEDGDQSWIAMEFVEGEDLDASLGKSGLLPLDTALTLSIQLAEALAYAHERGVIHRDFKPANVLLTQQALPKIADFGIAKLVQSSLHTQAGSVLGSPAYMSPEQALGKGSDARSDIYALGGTLYTMLCGRLPFEGDVESVIAQKLTGKPLPFHKNNGPMPEELKRLVSRMLAKEPDNRPASMDAVADSLKTILDV
jgi:predicted Ser/Thr protein kinase